MDYPNVSCDNCADILKIDEIEPRCFDGVCLIPYKVIYGTEIGFQGDRVLEIRSMIMSLHGLVDSGYILNLFEADEEDLQWLSLIEDEIKNAEKTSE